MELVPRERPRIIIFFGSTIGSLSEEEGDTFLRSVAVSMKPGDSFLLGLDMLKSREVLEAAYNDSRGITAEFNRNLLIVLNHELHADFDPSHFDHLAFFNEDESRVEMHLRANCDVEVNIGELGMELELSKERLFIRRSAVSSVEITQKRCFLMQDFKSGAGLLIQRSGSHL